jgi:lipase chaperone LimK
VAAATRWTVAAIGVALAWAASTWSRPDDAAPAALSTTVDRPVVAVARVAPPPAAPASAARDPAAFERWLEQHSSLRGVVLDGAWEVDAQGRLHASVALRRRFDQLLSLAGEASLDEITAYIAHDVHALAGPLAAQRVLDVWHGYLALQRHAYRTEVDMRQRSTWAPALAERQRVRQQVLGSQIAAAFFADDEAELQALLVQGGPLPPSAEHTTAIDRAGLAPQAAMRLQQEDAAWADWERRLAEARREHAALQARAELSAPQRDEAMQRFIAQRFDAGEAVRVKALLGL